MKRLVLALTVFILTSGFVMGNQGNVPPSVLIGNYEISDGARIVLDAPDIEIWLQEDQQDRELAGAPLRIGAARALPENVLLSADSIMDVDYGLIRRIAIHSPGALELKLRLQNVALPDSSVLYIYAEGEMESDMYCRQDVGVDGSIWSWGSPGPTIVLEWHWDEAPGVDAPCPFDLVMISHIYKDIDSIMSREGSCHNDATCDLDYRAQRDASALIEFNDAGTYLCSGIMLNNVQQDFIPYFLTANHCVYTQAIADSVKVWFFFHTEECDGPRPTRGFRTVMKSTLLSTGPAKSGKGSDFSLLRLAETDYTGVYYAGWDRRVLTTGTEVTGIHHPDGAYKRISYGTVRSDFQAGQWGVNWDRLGNPGVTEVGSSGSALFRDSNHYVVGQLWAGSSDCSNQDGRDFYGRFGMSYLDGALHQWLGTGETCPGAYWDESMITPTPAPTAPATQTPPPTATPTQAHGTPTPTSPPNLDVQIIMPSHVYHPGDIFACAVSIDNKSSYTAKQIVLIVILDVYGSLFFLPEFNEFSFYQMDFLPGETTLALVPAFAWPDGAGHAQNIFWYAGCTDTRFETVIGNVDSFEFGWTD